MSNSIIKLPENVENSLVALIKKNGFTTYEIKLSPGSKKGDNFAGVLYKVKVTGLKLNKEFGSLNFFVKIPISDKIVREHFFLRELFLLEIFTYNYLIPEYKAFQEEKGLRDGFVSFADCFATGEEENGEFVIMNDLTCEEFVMFDKNKQLDLAHIELVLKELGKLHALSFALKDQKPQVFAKFKEITMDKFFVSFTDDYTINYLNAFLKSAVDSLVFEGAYKTKWVTFHENYFDILGHGTNGNLAEPHAGICHADCWTNNILFKYKDAIPRELRFLDWQITRYASPVTDVVYFLFCSMDNSVRKPSYQALLNTYYDSFKTFLLKLGSDPEVLFPYSVFQNHLKKFGKHGLAFSIILVPNNSTPGEDAVTMDELIRNTSVATDNEKTKEACRQKLFDIVTEMVDLGYL